LEVTFCSLLHFAFYDVLHIVGGSLTIQQTKNI